MDSKNTTVKIRYIANIYFEYFKREFLYIAAAEYAKPIIPGKVIINPKITLGPNPSKGAHVTTKADPKIVIKDESITSP